MAHVQLAAPTFKPDRRLLPSEAFVAQALRALAEACARAFERSEHRAGGHDPDVATFTFRRDGEHPAPLGQAEVVEAYPAHVQVRTFHLSAAVYQAFVRDTYARLAARQTEEDGEGRCTLAFLAFDAPSEDVGGDSHAVSSFVPLAER